MAHAAVRFHGDPTAELRVVGITGTNGKTTTAFLVRDILERTGVQTGLVGTVKRVVGGVEEPVERTTPEAIDLQATFRRMVDGGDRACAIEVSSHALALRRVAGIRFAVAAFTNLTQDHLDFHADMEDYFFAKRMLFAAGHAESAVINVDDPYGDRLAAELEATTFSAAGAERADFRALDVSFDAAGSSFRLVAPDGETEVRLPLPGRFNVENAVCAIACTAALGVATEAAAAALAGVARVPGRFEPVDEGQPFAVLVDYAHTPDSLENVLISARQVTSPPGRVICVFGCGGDRDRDKRPLMGEIAARLADLAVVTSDNPRSEDPGAIIDEILEGAGRGPGEVRVEGDRRAAIALALAAAGDSDTVVIAGKGHEQGQEFEGGRKIPFDDREVAGEELRRLAAPAANAR
jgi:UDP-N-acetylmuramoyl-L-alanyl-D-glutamate--2,6-diaminopimelate ligase